MWQCIGTLDLRHTWRQSWLSVGLLVGAGGSRKVCSQSKDHGYVSRSPAPPSATPSGLGLTPRQPGGRPCQHWRMGEGNCPRLQLRGNALCGVAFEATMVESDQTREVLSTEWTLKQTLLRHVPAPARVSRSPPLAAKRGVQVCRVFVPGPSLACLPFLPLVLQARRQEIWQEPDKRQSGVAHHTRQERRQKTDWALTPVQSAGGACAGAAPHLSRPFGPPTSRLVSSCPSHHYSCPSFPPLPPPDFLSSTSHFLTTPPDLSPLHHHPSFSPDLSSVKMPARLFVGYVFLTSCAPSTLNGSLVLIRALLPSQ